MINRSSPPGPYWDEPAARVSPPDARLQFVTFFDFDELGRRDFKYLEVHMAEFAGRPQLVGRRALVEFEHVRIFVVRDGVSGADGR